MQENLYNLAFERSVLNSIIFDSRQFEDVDEVIFKEDFYLPAHQNIYESMVSLTHKNLPIDEEFIKKELSTSNKFDEQVMLEIMLQNPISNLRVYCEEVKELSSKRRLLHVTTAIKRGVVEDELPSNEVISNILHEIKLIEENDNNSIKVRTQSEARIEAAAMPKMPKYETGLDVVDNYFDGGLELAQLVMLGGEKGSGKTAFTLQFLYNVSNGFKSAYLSYEMPWWKIQARFDKLKPSEKQSDNFYIIDEGRDISEIEKNIRKLARDGVRFFTVDSLMKIRNKYLNAKRHEQVSDITDRLSSLCMELSIIIVLIVQVSNEDLKNGRMAVKNSGDADHDADVMFFIQKVKDNYQKRFFVCEKNRQNGNEFKEEVYINPKTVKFQTHAPALYEIEYTSTINDSPRIGMPEIR